MAARKKRTTEERSVHPVSGLDIIAAERARQVEWEGWTAEHDDGHDAGELAIAAACYASPELIYVEERHVNSVGFIDPWPWDEADDKRPRDGNVILPNRRLPRNQRLRQLAKAGALIAAEIDRLQRMTRLRKFYCEICDRWYLRGGDCPACGSALQRGA